jgi:hypothetical protein
MMVVPFAKAMGLALAAVAASNAGNALTRSSV